MKYPEHQKLKAVSEGTQSAGEFIEWLQAERGIVLAEHFEYIGGGGTQLIPANASLVNLLADWQGIDRNKIEQEKRQMLDELRALNIEEGK